VDSNPWQKTARSRGCCFSSLPVSFLLLELAVEGKDVHKDIGIAMTAVPTRISQQFGLRELSDGDAEQIYIERGRSD
jgi:hypothetical protein